MKDTLIDQVAMVGAKDVQGPIRGIVIFFNGLGYTGRRTELDPAEQRWAQAGGLVVMPYAHPWAWMNDQTQAFSDELLDALKARHALPDDLPVVAAGLSMGGQGALLYSAVSRHPIAGCRVFMPVCDLVYHYGERPDLPRTMHCAFGSYGDIEPLLEQHSPLHQVHRMRDIPYFLAHGDADQSVNKERHSDRLVQAMRSRGLKVDYREVPGANHGGPWPPDVYDAGTQFVIDCFTRPA